LITAAAVRRNDEERGMSAAGLSLRDWHACDNVFLPILRLVGLINQPLKRQSREGPCTFSDSSFRTVVGKAVVIGSVKPHSPGWHSWRPGGISPGKAGSIGTRE
jgi:hypothetical protein